MIEWLVVLFIYTFFMALAAWWGRQKGYKDGFENGKYIQRAEDEIQLAVMRDKLVKLEKTCMRQRRWREQE